MRKERQRQSSYKRNTLDASVDFANILGRDRATGMWQLGVAEHLVGHSLVQLVWEWRGRRNDVARSRPIPLSEKSTGSCESACSARAASARGRRRRARLNLTIDLPRELARNVTVAYYGIRLVELLYLLLPVHDPGKLRRQLEKHIRS